MSVVRRDTSKNRVPERDLINSRIGRLYFAKSLVQAAAHNRFPEVDFSASVQTATAGQGDNYPQQHATTTGARAVSQAMTVAAHEQLRSEADRNVANAIAEPGPVTSTEVPSQNVGGLQVATETLSPEQIQHISNAQQLVERALNEPPA